MNITILSLLSSSLISHSPAFVENRLTVSGSQFKLFTCLLFYNQENFHLENSRFSKGLNGIILNEKDSELQQTFTEEYTGTTAFTYPNTLKSLTILNCIFNKVEIPDNTPVQIESGSISVYITDSLFDSCKSKEGVIYLKSARCLTMTHTCSYKSHSKYSAAFLYYQLKKNDFSVSLYNSIIESASDDNTESFTSVYQYGDQYHRCNNMSKTQCSGYHFITAQCLLFEMNTMYDTSRQCVKMSAYTNTEFYGDKAMSHVNLFGKGESDKPILYLDSGPSITLTISDSVLLHMNTYLVQFDGANRGFSLVLQNCVIPARFSGYNNDNVKTSGCTALEYNENQLVIYPHFTRGDYCKGVAPAEPESVKNCNVGDCIDNCERSISFPQEVYPYTTIFHGDIQTPTSPPTAKFSPSTAFSESLKFSESDDFSGSKKFLDSSPFTVSEVFSESTKFTKTDVFSETNKFSDSNKFSKSDFFTESDDLISINLVKTSEFSYSDFFTNSRVFSPSSAIVDRDKSVGDDKKLSTGALAGIVIGAIAAAAIIALIVFFLIKKRNNLVNSGSADMVETKDSSITVDNNLEDIMDKDDPFAEEFNK